MHAYPLDHLKWWEQRIETHQKIIQANEYVRSLGFMEKSVLIDVIQRSLDLARDNVESWLDDSLTMSEDGDHFVLEFHFLKAAIEKEVVEKRRISNRHAMELKAKMEELFGETVDGEG